MQEVLDQYDIQVKDIFKSRDAFIVVTNQGLKALKPVVLHSERINFIYDLQLLLEKKGLHIDRINKTKDNTLFATFDDKKYILKNWVKGREVYLNDSQEVIEAIKVLGKIHNDGRVTDIKESYCQYDKTASLIEIFDKHTKELIRVRNRIRKLRRWSDFDIMYLNSFDYFFEQACRVFKKCDTIIMEAAKLYDENKVVVHGQYNHHNIILDRNRICIFNFEYATYNLPCTDLYHMMRKVLEKNDWEYCIGKSMFDEYNKINPLHTAEKKVINLLFEYPEKYWKISNYYANLNRAWKPKQTLVKLKKLNHQEAKRQAFIRRFKEHLNLDF